VLGGTKGKTPEENPWRPKLPLEKHQAIPPLDDVSVYLHCISIHNVLILIFILFSYQPVMKKFVALGTECLQFKAATSEAKGKQPDVCQSFELLLDNFFSV
jgi:hypothetical protein